MASSTTYTGDYSRTGKPEADKSGSMIGKAAEAAGRVVGTVEEAAKSAGDKAASVAGRVAETTGRIVGTVEEAAPSLREARDGVTAVGSDVYSAIRKSAKKQPISTLFVAAAVGFVVGAIWKS
jgi:ElaB/YqjD/DUF883 family membrane-anchored ribosome-binding protein